jgi:perosamine synthetase
MIKLEELCIDHQAALREALAKMDANAQGVLFVVKKYKLAGIITDGDVRRSIISGKTVNDPISTIYNRNCVFLSCAVSTEEIQSNLNDKIKVIPLVDENLKVVDYASIYRLHRISVLEPLLGGNELEYVTECIKTNWISSQGKYVQKFEDEIMRYTGAKYALAVSNGTSALHLALVALGIQAGDEVIVPDITFGATLNAVILAGGIPVIVDVDRQSWNISSEKIKESITSKTKAIMPVHIYGAPCEMPEIMEIAATNKLLVIEDCAEALGSSISNKHVGTFGDAGTFSFFGNKVITCGEGGAVIFNDESSYNRAKILRDHGMTPGKRYWHDVVGFNYRLTNLQAAVGCAQFEQLPDFREKRKLLFSWYEKHLLPSGYFDVQVYNKDYRSSYWLFTVLINKNCSIERDLLINKLAKKGIDSRPVFYPMSRMPPFLEYPTNLDGTGETISSKGISLPTSVYLTEDDVIKISKRIIECIKSDLEFREVEKYA